MEYLVDQLIEGQWNMHRSIFWSLQFIFISSKEIWRYWKKIKNQFQILPIMFRNFDQWVPDAEIQITRIFSIIKQHNFSSQISKNLSEMKKSISQDVAVNLFPIFCLTYLLLSYHLNRVQKISNIRAE